MQKKMLLKDFETVLMKMLLKIEAVQMKILL